MTIAFKVSSGEVNRRTFRNIKQMPHQMRRGITRALHEAGKEMRDDSVKAIRAKGKTGIVYKIRGRRHQSSARGEAPARLTGELIKSIDWLVLKGSLGLIYGAGDTPKASKYARRLEVTLNRPYLKPAVRKVQKTLPTKVENKIKQLISQI